MTAEFESVFIRLKSLLEHYAPHLIVVHDEPGNYYLDTPVIGPNKKPLFFGSAQIKKNYVSYYFMPVYVFPDLLDALSEALKKRQQGKSCFNFKTVDTALLDELAA